MLHFELHPYIPEIHKNMLVYEKGVLMKHIKTPERVKSNLLICDNLKWCDNVE